jgi:hypothetical protein
MTHNIKFSILAQSFTSPNQITRTVWAATEDAALQSVSLELEASDCFFVSIRRI